jgi:nucleoside-diphosphate-sugar epimerase
LKAIIPEKWLDRAQFMLGDITDADVVRRSVQESKANKIIHLAGVQVPACKADPLLGAKINVIGTLNVFQAAKTAGLERVVYASSAAVFGMSDDGRPLDESVRPEPGTHYGVFKHANEGNARVYFLDHKLSSAGLRPYTVYGVGRDTGMTSDPTKAMKAAVLGRPFHIRFGGATDFQYVADTAAAFIASADRCQAGAHVFNLHGETIQVATIVETIRRHLPMGSRELVTFGGPPIPIAPELRDEAIRAAVGPLPSTPLSTGIRETIERFQQLREEGRLDTSDLET